jgi:hypothetical protein
MMTAEQTRLDFDSTPPPSAAAPGTGEGFTQDLRQLPVGTFVGGAVGRTVRCPTCGQAGVVQPGRVRVAHVLKIKLVCHEPTVTLHERCAAPPFVASDNHVVVPPSSMRRRPRERRTALPDE